MSKTYTLTTYITGYCHVDCLNCEVDVAYSPGRPGRNYMPNGDPGYPDEPDELELLAVRVDGSDVLTYLTDSQMDQLDERCRDLIYEQTQADEAAYWDHYAKSIKEEA